MICRYFEKLKKHASSSPYRMVFVQVSSSSISYNVSSSMRDLRKMNSERLVNELLLDLFEFLTVNTVFRSFYDLTFLLIMFFVFTSDDFVLDTFHQQSIELFRFVFG